MLSQATSIRVAKHLIFRPAVVHPHPPTSSVQTAVIPLIVKPSQLCMDIMAESLGIRPGHLQPRLSNNDENCNRIFPRYPELVCESDTGWGGRLRARPHVSYMEDDSDWASDDGRHSMGTRGCTQTHSATIPR